MTPTPTATPTATLTPTARESASLQLAELVSWFRDPPGSIYAQVAGLLLDLWMRDDALGTAIAGLPWIAQVPIGDEVPSILRHLRSIASSDPDLARQTAGLPWLIDGVTEVEAWGLHALGRIAVNDLELTRMTATLPWFIDGVTEVEAWGLHGMGRIAVNDLELTRMTATLPWFIDGVTEVEAWGLHALDRIADNDLELASKTAGMPWFVDGVSGYVELQALHALGNIVASKRELAREIKSSPWLSWQGHLPPYLIWSLDVISARPDAFDKLTAQPWFDDGLNDEEAAFVVVLSGMVGRPLYADLLAAHSTKTKTVSLPLAGDVRIWVFQEVPFPLHDDTLTIIEDTARITEGFLGVPFPTTDIILLIASDEQRIHGWHAGRYMVLTRYSGAVSSVRHETAHYYFNTGPRWFVEGGAQFVEAYVKDRTNSQSIRERRFQVSREADECLVPNQRENIHEFEYVWSQGTVSSYCVYTLGENFLLRVLATIGEEAMSATLMEVLVGGRITEEKIYEAFVEHAPPEKRKRFLNLYRTLHGGPYGDDSG